MTQGACLTSLLANSFLKAVHATDSHEEISFFTRRRQVIPKKRVCLFNTKKATALNTQDKPNGLCEKIRFNGSGRRFCL